MSKALRFLRKKTFNVLIGVDQFANVLLLGKPDETISSRVGRAYLKGKPLAKPARAIIDTLFLPFGKDHCVKAIEWEELEKTRTEAGLLTDVPSE